MEAQPNRQRDSPVHPLPYAIPGPRNIRAGKNKIPFSNPNTPSTAIPKIRNGKRINHTNGYAISASKASGQHSTSKMHHKRNRMDPLRTFIY
jgi:hypothetical protein